MTACRSHRRPTRLVWLDSREAFIVHPEADRMIVAHLASTVPVHHRSMGHVRRDPHVRCGGGMAQAGAERRRNQLVEQFVTEVAHLLPPEDDLLLLGPGTAREHLAHRLVEGDRARHAIRSVVSHRAARVTVPQLVARLRRATGEAPPRGRSRRTGWLPRRPEASPAATRIQ